MSIALAQSGYRTIEELFLGSCGQTLSKMVVGARKRAHTTRAKGTPIAEEVDGLAAKFIGNAWHFRVYADIIAQYKEEGFVPKGERELGEIPAEDYEEELKIIFGSEINAKICGVKINFYGFLKRF